jgi:hypothetical protein
MDLRFAETDAWVNGDADLQRRYTASSTLDWTKHHYALGWIDAMELSYLSNRPLRAYHASHLPAGSQWHTPFHPPAHNRYRLVFLDAGLSSTTSFIRRRMMVS